MGPGGPQLELLPPGGGGCILVSIQEDLVVVSLEILWFSVI